MTSIYLDNNSTTPILPEVAAAMADCYAAGYANPASQHQQGRRARQRIEQAREKAARILGAELGGRTPDKLIFTSGGTEANHLAILGMAGVMEAKFSPPYEAIVSSIEHPSILGPAELLERRGWKVHRAAVTIAGVVCLDSLRGMLNERTKFVSIMLANNETGVIQPVAEIAKICRDLGVLVHTDASQAVGKLAFTFQELGVDAMTIAAHKLHGPVGIGALVLRAELPIQPLFVGGFQQAGYRPGTESVALAVGLESALLAFERDGDERISRMRQLRDRFEFGLIGENMALTINGRESQRLPTTSNVAFIGLDRQQLLLTLDLAGLCCSTGSACASGSSEPSHVLKAMGLANEVVNSSLRFSLGATTAAKEIDLAVATLREVCGRIGKSTP
jgi:cysteine desulfurase